MTAPILIETIGNNIVSLRPLQNGGYILSVTTPVGGGVKEITGKTYHRLDQATNEFYYAANRLTTYTYGQNHYEG